MQTPPADADRAEGERREGAEPRGRRPSAAPALTFPDLPRLELDELLGQLVERAQEVLATQGRLRALLRANQGVVADLELPALLRRIPEVARELLGAGYAGLGVVAEGAAFSEFVHVGLPPELSGRADEVPPVEGPLRTLLDDPAPLRLPSAPEAADGPPFPFGSPPRGGFLGVPIWVRGEVFAHLVLADSVHGEFSDEDQELVASLVATAGVAIGNARLYEVGRLRQRWLQASAAITQRLLADEGGDSGRALTFIAETSRNIADADLVVVLLPDQEAGRLRVEAAVGAAADRLVGRSVAVDGSLSGEVYGNGRPVRDFWPDGGRGLAAQLPDGLQLGPVLAVPLTGPRQVNGVLTVGRARGRMAFAAEDVEMAAGFANQASIALALAEARVEHEQLAMLDDRARIAGDLHADVIQLLFSAGMSLQGLATSLGPGRPAARLRIAIADIDRAIDRIRAAVFALREQVPAHGSGVGGQLLDVITDYAAPLGFEPTTRFTGPLDGLAEDLVADLVAVLRESLTNVARHARAHACEVEVTVDDGQATVQVVDDGIGGAGSPKDGGLADLLRRASWHGGSLDVGAGPTGRGTCLRWSVPLRSVTPSARAASDAAVPRERSGRPGT